MSTLSRQPVPCRFLVIVKGRRAEKSVKLHDGQSVVGSGVLRHWQEEMADTALLSLGT